MLTVYRLETFTRDGFNPRGMAVIENPEIVMDYLTLENTKVICKDIESEWGDWCRIIDQSGTVVYTGYVDNIIKNDKITELTLRPLQAIFDMPSTVQYRHRGGRFNSCEVAIRMLYYTSFVLIGDTYAKIPYRYAELTTTTECPAIPTPQQVVNNAWNLGIYYLTQSGVSCDIQLDIANKEIVIKGENIANQLVIETDKDYVLDYEISEGSNSGYNSVGVYYNESGSSFSIRNYCLHTDGSIDTHLEDVEIIDGQIVHTPYDRIFPVKYAETYADTGTDDSGNEYVYTKAVELLQSGKWVNEIKITLLNDNKIIDVNSPIGTKAIVINGGVAYETILTGFIKKSKVTTLLFGTIRGELTKQMAIERISTGSDIQQTSNSTSGGQEWSTDHETIVGKWINGKPVYRKCAYRGNIGSGSTSMTFALDNPETIVNVAGLGDEGAALTNAHYQLPYANPVDTRYSLGMFYRSGAINFRGGSAVAIKNAYVWVDYTKTTDAGTSTLSLEE